MTVATTEDGTLVTLHPDGPLDAELAESLQVTTCRALEEGRSRVVLNLQKVPHASSAGLEVVVQLARKIADADGGLAVVGANVVMRDIFRATRLDRRLAVFDSTEAAMQSLRKDI